MPPSLAWPSYGLRTGQHASNEMMKQPSAAIPRPSCDLISKQRAYVSGHAAGTLGLTTANRQLSKWRPCSPQAIVNQHATHKSPSCSSSYPSWTFSCPSWTSSCASTTKMMRMRTGNRCHSGTGARPPMPKLVPDLRESTASQAPQSCVCWQPAGWAAKLQKICGCWTAPHLRMRRHGNPDSVRVAKDRVNLLVHLV